MTDDIIARLLEPDFHDPACPFHKHCYCDDGAPHDRVQHPLAREAAASIERLRRLLHKYGDRIPLATNARPDWQQEIDEAFEWVANNPERSDGWTEKGRAWLDAGAPLGANYEWWAREGLTEPCPNWREGTRRCNCKACRARRKAAA